MAAIEILNIKKLGIHRDQLGFLLEDCIESGASIGFLAPIEAQEISDYLNELDIKLKQGDRHLWIAMHDNQIIGSVQLALTTKKNGLHRAEVEKLMVLRAARKQGIATQLLNQLQHFAQHIGLRLLVLDTREGDVSELLYVKFGFIRAGVIPNFALSSTGHYDGTVIYYKNIVSIN